MDDDPHTATSGPLLEPDGLWNTPVFSPGMADPIIRFNTPGIFLYYCQIHPEENMVGSITVVP